MGELIGRLQSRPVAVLYQQLGLRLGQVDAVVEVSYPEYVIVAFERAALR